MQLQFVITNPQPPHSMSETSDNMHAGNLFMIESSKCDISQTTGPIFKPFETYSRKKYAEQNKIYEDYILIRFLRNI
jgi:hypothetical protein